MIHAPERRRLIWEWLSTATAPLTGTELSERLGVSRQIIVSDMAAIREQHPEVIATRRGYCLSGATPRSRVFKVLHDDAAITDELQAIVDLGGYVRDVFVYHKAYGRIAAQLSVRCRHDVEQLLEKISSGKSRSLLSTASGYHYHTVEALSEERLDAIEDALKVRGYLLDSAADAETIS